MKIKPTAAILIAPILLTGCMSPDPVITKRYSSASFWPPEEWSNDKTINISVFVMAPEDKSSSKTVFELSERGQEAYINAIAKDSTDSATLQAALAGPIAAPNSQGRDRKREKQSRRLVFSLQKNDIYPGDRIHSARLRLNIDENCAKFVSWSRFQNEIKTIQLGKLNAVQTNTTTIAGSFTPPPQTMLGAITASNQSTRGLTENVELKRDLVKISGRLEDGMVTIDQQGAPEIDLEGVLSADLTIALNRDPGKEQLAVFASLSPLFDGTTPKKLSEVTASRKIVYYFPVPTKVMASLEYDYILRTISQGADTVIEADDVARYTKNSGSLSKPFLLTSSRDQRLFSYKVAGVKNDEMQWWNPSAKAFEPMQFETFEEAEELLRWIKRVRSTVKYIGGYRLKRPSGTPSQWGIRSVSLTKTPKTCAPK